MASPSAPDSIARPINVANAQPNNQGDATVNPIFTWVRLAQRIPIRIHIDEVPTGIVLTAGMTAAVQVEPRSGRPIGSLGVECSSNYACCAPVRAPSIL